MWFLKPNINKLHKRENVEGLIKALEYKDDKIRSKAASALGALRDIFAIDALIKALGDNVWAVRKNAAEALGNIGSMKAVRPLIELLKDEDTYVREATIEALGKIGLPDDNNIKTKYALARKDWKLAESLGDFAVAPLLDLLKSEEKNDRKGAAEALGGIRDEKSIEPLIELVRKDRDREVRGAAACALCKFERQFEEEIMAICAVAMEDWPRVISLGKASIKPLTGSLKGEKREFKMAAIKALGEIGDPEALETLLSIHKNEDNEMKMIVNEAFGKIKDNSSVDLLIKDLSSKTKEVRYSATTALGNIGDNRAVEPLILLLNDEYPWVRQAAAKALGQIGDKKAIAPFINLLDSKDSQLIFTAVESLGAIGDSDVVEPLIAVLAHDDALVRKAGADALGKIGDKKAVDPLIEILSDESEPPRIAATIALGKIGDKKATRHLQNLLQEEDWTIRRAAIESLGEMGDSGSVSLLIKYLNDDNETVRKAAKTAFEKIKAPEDPDERAIFAVAKRDWALAESLGEKSMDSLIVALKDREPTVRMSAADTIGKIGVPDDPSIQALLTVVKKDWENVIQYGKTAIDPLVWSLKVFSREDYKNISDILIKIGKISVEPLFDILKEKDVELKIVAIETLGEIGDERAIKPLIFCLRDDSHLVRKSAADSLCKFGDAALDPLVYSLRDSRETVRQAAAEALGRLGNKKAAKPLARLLTDRDNDVRKTAIESLGILKDDRTVKSLVSLLEDNDSSIREAAARGLGMKDNFAAVKPLLSLLRDDIIPVKKAALISLGQIGSPASVEELKSYLNDENIEIQKIVIVALGEIGNSKALEPLIEVLKDEGSPHKIEVIKSLGKIKNLRAVMPLMELCNSKDKEVKLEAVRSLGTIGNFKAIKTLITASRDEDPDIRKAANEALNKIEKPLDATIQAVDAVHNRDWEHVVAFGRAAVEPLTSALYKGNTDIREAALALLAIEGDNSLTAQAFLCKFGEDEERDQAKSVLLKSEEKSVPYLIKALKSAYAPVEVVEILKELGDKNAVAPLKEEREKYSKGSGEQDKQMVEAIEDALNSLGEVRELDKLKELLINKEDDEQRKGAADSLIKLSMPDSIMGYVYLLRYGNIHERKDALKKVLAEKPQKVEKAMNEIIDEKRSFLVVFNKNTGEVLDVFLTYSYTSDGETLIVHQKNNHLVALKPDKGFLEIKPRGIDFVFNFKPICYLLMKAELSEFIVIKNSFLKLRNEV